MIKALGNGGVSVGGLASLDYCPSCNQAEKEAQGFLRASNTSSFYFQRLFGYNLTASLGVSVGVPGANIETGLSLMITDQNIFDDNGPDIVLPSASAIRDSLKFSPRNALTMLQFFDGESRPASPRYCMEYACNLLCSAGSTRKLSLNPFVLLAFS